MKYSRLVLPCDWNVAADFFKAFVIWRNTMCIRNIFWVQNGKYVIFFYKLQHTVAEAEVSLRSRWHLLTVQYVVRFLHIDTDRVKRYKTTLGRLKSVAVCSLPVSRTLSVSHESSRCSIREIKKVFGLDNVLWPWCL